MKQTIAYRDGKKYLREFVWYDYMFWKTHEMWKLRFCIDEEEEKIKKGILIKY